MAKEPLQFDVSVTGAGRAASDLRNLGQAGEKSLNEASNALDRFLDELDQLGAKTRTEAEEVDRAAKAVADALGPELAARVGPGIRDTIDQLQQVGVTAREVEERAERVADSLRRLDDVNTSVRGTATAWNEVDTSVRRVGDSTDRSRGVMANFAGNAAQDIPGISGSFGALNVAIGQFAEYATEGGVSLRNFVKAAGPIALGTLAVTALSKAFTDSRARAEEHRKTVGDLAEAIRDGESASDALVRKWEELGKIDVQLPDFLGGDLADEFERLGLSASQFMQIVNDPASFAGWRSEMEAGGAAAADLDAVGRGVIVTMRTLGESEDRAARNTRLFGEATDESTEAVERATAATMGRTEALRTLNEQMQEHVDGVLSQIDAELALEESMRTVGESVADLDRVYADSEASAEDRQDALDSAVRAAIRLGDDWVAAAEAQNGEVALSAEDTARIQREALASVADDLGPTNPLRVRLDEYIARLEAIPRYVSTDITISGNAAGPIRGAKARGGPVAGGSTYLVGEEGPELFTPSGSGNIIPNDRLGGGLTVNVYGVAVKEVPRLVADEILWEMRTGG